ncbi:amino acid deaminase/aldolase [Cryobacterium sp. TMT1-21]|uniref:Amino acid deaminase/aldolase n=1 Tax=Cryobacterium shii TaxID=1259235 RepID=A0AAQ2C7Y3_9MICO|nr:MULTISPECIES: amino acid deaminase/aldolase [Cryobacterium]TFC51185.1 amino acid deaminase/aldolase [Cryobacterium shii]TFC80512.1 amino acid deaminase/aldolase [Cryobacterium sp. TmT2-59]TFD11374.1 amino acid deaminase/aldolase [Cryobacterium sp. TMT1-21]TFD17476.1 amino acid deaminase/aldolase [Cryobacterium sp. TMT4-10]TFD18808.1 amino acid deaminase/aldolase [Cryobacterium sp. TMT2-23]
MGLDLGSRPASQPWLTPGQYWPGLTAATAQLETPVAALHLDALRHNTRSLLGRAGGTPIRVATKSIRVRGVIEALLTLPGFQGVLAYTLAEALWLAETVTDVVVGYPTADRSAIRRLGTSPHLAATVTLMIDSVAQLDEIDAVLPPAGRAPIRVCLELDAAWDAPVLGHLGVWRSPVHTPADARSLAAAVVARPGFSLVGLMAYEAQVAGIGDRPAGKPVQGRVNRWVRRRSVAEIADRRSAAVAAVREIVALEFVNGGGTGSLETTRADASVTDIAAGSGFFGGHLFDHYASFRPAPAAAVALSIVRKPSPATGTLLGGGWVASGVPGRDRLPRLVWPEGLRLMPREMAGEVQTPLTGPGAAGLSVGDRVWLRHAKSGELSEHVNEFALVDNGRVVDILPTYRGEGKAFL